MRNRKIRYGEQKLLDLIDKEMQNKTNLDFLQIKDKIIIEEDKGIRKVESKRNRLGLRLKYGMAIILLIITIIAFFTVCSINNNTVFEKNSYLSEQLIEKMADYKILKNNSSYYKNTGLLAIMANHEYNSKYIELTVSSQFDNKYYCAYIDRKIIRQVNDYYENSNLSNSEKYQYLYNNNLFIGIDDMLLKIYLYFEKLNSVGELLKYLKWVEYEDDEKIKYNIGKHQIIYLATIKKADKVLNISSNNNFSKEINIYKEVNFIVNKNIISVEQSKNNKVTKYLYKIENIDDCKSLDISMMYLEQYCAEIVDINNKDCVYINIPKWYKPYINYLDSILYNDLNINLLKVKSILIALDDYKIGEKNYNFSDNLYYNQYIYEYNMIKVFLLS